MMQPLLFLCRLLLPLGLLVGSATGQTRSGKVTGNSDLGNHLFLILDQADQKAIIQITGPAGVYTAWGFGGTAMAGTYAIIADGSGAVSERILGNHNAGSLLPSSRSKTVVVHHNGNQHVYIERPLVHSNFTFTSTAAQLDLIWAVGSGSTLAKHPGSQRATLPVATPPVAVPVARIERLQGAVALRFTGLTASVTQHLEYTPQLKGASPWQPVTDFICLPDHTMPSLVVSTNVQVTIDNDLKGYFRIRHGP